LTTDKLGKGVGVRVDVLVGTTSVGGMTGVGGITGVFVGAGVSVPPGGGTIVAVAG
jgi:hypothetical protein